MGRSTRSTTAPPTEPTEPTEPTTSQHEVAEVDNSHLPEQPGTEISEPGLDHDGNPLPRTANAEGKPGVATEGAGQFAAQAPAVAHAGDKNADPRLPRLQAGVAAGETQPGIPPPGEASGESVMEKAAEDENAPPAHVDRRGDFLRVGRHFVQPGHIVRMEKRDNGSVHVVTVSGEVNVPSQHADAFHKLLGTNEPGTD